MNNNRVTLQYLAQKAGVTVSTVHKALHGAKGVSEQKRQEILALAVQLQYTQQLETVQRSYRFAAVFPRPVFDNQFFFQPLWAGIRKRMEELEPFHIILSEFMFDSRSTCQQECLREICERHPGEFDALLTAVWDEGSIGVLIDRLADSDTAVFTVSSDAPLSRRTAAVRSNPYSTGRLAAEYLGSVLPPACRTIMAGTNWDANNHLRLVRGFFDQMSEASPTIEIIELYESASCPEKLYETLRELVDLLGDVKGIFLTNARATGHLCSIMPRFSELHRLRIVGSELFEQSAEGLRNGTLHAIIDHNAFEQGYRAVELAFQKVVCGKQPEPLTVLPVRLLLKSSLL